MASKEQRETILGCFIIWVVMLIFGAIVLVLVSDSESDERFMAECQADGRKRYECEAMLKGSR